MRTLLLVVCVLFPFRTSAQEKRAGDELRRISDVMEAVGESLRRTNTGRKTQAQQADVIARLQEMIDQLEQQQSSAGGSGQLPASTSGLAAGASQTGKPRGLPPTAAQKWGGVKPAARAAIEAELHSSMPARYRRLLVQYFACLARSGR